MRECYHAPSVWGKGIIMQKTIMILKRFRFWHALVAGVALKFLSHNQDVVGVVVMTIVVVALLSIITGEE